MTFNLMAKLPKLKLNNKIQEQFQRTRKGVWEGEEGGEERG